MTAEWTAAVGRYARRLHHTAGAGHHVASPLGAWLLLALAARAGDDELAEALGMDPGAAAEVAAALLSRPHPLVAAASAVWHRDGLDLGGLAGWRAGLPAEVTFGPVPGQAGLDSWAREHTFGLIDSFPLELTPEVVLALATALATKVSWADPFEAAPAAALGGGEWATRLGGVLRTPEIGHRAYVARSRDAGEVIVHVASSGWRDDRAKLHVVSVAAATEVPPERVLAAAYELGASAALDTQPPARISLFDLPLGESPLWTIREQLLVSRSREICGAVLPAWSAKSDLDLDAPELGFAALSKTLAPMLGTGGGMFQARQAAMARYTRYGFEAAAVTGYFEPDSAPDEETVRVAELRFGHPFAVVAIAAQPGMPPGPWHGVPVFSAWVADPDDA